MTEILQNHLAYLKRVITTQQANVNSILMLGNKDTLTKAKRHVYIKYEKYLQEYLDGNLENRLMIIAGFRGTGKTTLLAQLFESFKDKFDQVLFISIDRPHNMFNGNLTGIIQALEDIEETEIELIQERILLFVDEIQYDPKWALTLKTLFDRSKRICVIATGSSAIQLHSSPDLTRRARFEILQPMNFTEYRMITTSIKQPDRIQYPTPGLMNKLKQSIFHSNNAEQAYRSLLDHKKEAEAYINKITNSKKEFNNYLRWYTIPFLVDISDEHARQRALYELLMKVVQVDLPKESTLIQETINKIPSILFSLAGSLTPTENSLGNINNNTSRDTVRAILQALTQSGIVIKIPPYTKSHNTRPSKILFASPAFRYNLLAIASSEGQDQTNLGYLLEDLIGLYLNKLFKNYGVTNVFYDSQENGCDFLITTGKSLVAIEVKMGKLHLDQLVATGKKHKLTYGIFLSPKVELSLDKEHQIITVPLQYFLLL